MSEQKLHVLLMAKQVLLFLLSVFLYHFDHHLIEFQVTSFSNPFLFSALPFISFGQIDIRSSYVLFCLGGVGFKFLSLPQKETDTPMDGRLWFG